MESRWPSVVAILLYTLTVVEGVLIEEGQEVVNFTCADSGRINVTMMCVGKYSNVISSSYVVIRWYDFTNPSNKVLIMTIDNATQVSLGPDIDNTTVVERLSTDRLDGSIFLSLKLKEEEKTLPYKVFTCDVQALSDTPSVYNRPVFAYSSCCDCDFNQTCPPSTPDGTDRCPGSINVTDTLVANDSVTDNLVTDSLVSKNLVMTNAVTSNPATVPSNPTTSSDSSNNVVSYGHSTYVTSNSVTVTGAGNSTRTSDFSSNPVNNSTSGLIRVCTCACSGCTNVTVTDCPVTAEPVTVNPVTDPTSGACVCSGCTNVTVTDCPVTADPVTGTPVTDPTSGACVYGGPGVIAGVLCLILSIVCLTMLFLAVFVPYLKGSSFIGLVQAHGTCCLVLTLCVLVIGAILSFAGFIVACIYLSKLAVDTSCEKFQDLIIAATVCSVVGLVCAVYILVVGVQKQGVNGWWLSNKSREFTVDATNSRPKSTGNVSKKDVELCVNKGNNHSSPRRRKNSVEPKDGEKGVPQPIRGTPRQLPPMPAYDRRQPPPMPPVDTTSSPVKKVRKKKKKTHTPEEL